ncbi:MFS transporter [Frigoribacterium sp. 2-23]|uniref:MFS transporter n=1 Tax=Frigoribacterium sp. 2-23 TaxID=3415006 RepID=UPI003C6F7AA0
MTAVLALTGMVAALMQMLVIPIVPEFPRLLDVQASDATWIVTATLLSAAVFTPIAGRLGDLYGKRRIVLVLLVVMIVGSVIAASSSVLLPLIVGRALQGAAIGVIPLGISILRDTLHPDRLGGAVALVSATLGFGGAIGLPLSAWISQTYDWHVLFWTAAGLGVVVLVLVAVFIPVSTLRTGGRFDLPGAIGLAVGLTGVLLAVSKGNDWGWTSVSTLVSGLVGLVVLVLFGWYQLRVASPLVDLRVAVRPAVLLTNLASIALGFALFGSNVSLPQLLELPTETGVGLGQTIMVASLCLAPSGVVMMLMAPVASRATARFGARLCLVVGGALIVVSYAVAALFFSQVWQIVLVSVLIGFGIGLAYAAMPTLIMHAVPATETAAANGLNTLMRSLGTTSASAVVGLLLTANSVPFGDALVPTADGFRLTFVIGGVAALVSVVIALFIPRREPRYERAALPAD